MKGHPTLFAPLFLAFLATGFAGCVLDPDMIQKLGISPSPPTELPQDPGDSDSDHTLLHGHWEAPCKSEKTHSFEAAFHVINGEYIHISQGYTDTDCASPYLIIVRQGRFEIGRTTATASGVPSRELDLTTESILAVPIGGAMIRYLNRTRECGFSDWSDGVSREVTGLACAYLGEGRTRMRGEGAREHSLFAFGESADGSTTLRLGRHTSASGDTPATRYRELEDRLIYKKVLY